MRSNRTNYKIDWWDNGRTDPYRIIFKKNGVKSVYKFLESGSLSTLTIGNTRYTFSQSAGSLEVQSSEDISSRMLLAPGDESANEVHSGHRRLYDCPDCEETWDTLCDVGIEEVCYWVELLPSVFYWDAQYSLTVMCTAMGAACDTSAADTCEGQCIEGEMNWLFCDAPPAKRCINSTAVGKYVIRTCSFFGLHGAFASSNVKVRSECLPLNPPPGHLGRSPFVAVLTLSSSSNTLTSKVPLPSRLQLRSLTRLQLRSSTRLQLRSPTRLQLRSPTRLQLRSPTRLQLRSPTRLLLRSSNRLLLRSPTRLQLRSSTRHQLRSSIRRRPLRLRSRRRRQVNGCYSRGKLFPEYAYCCRCWVMPALCHHEPKPTANMCATK